jgi:alkylation response protein AidB-like acyl-CoA dehydrogenase
VKVTSRYRAVDEAESRRRTDRRIAWMRDYAERRINSRLIDERRTIPPYVVMDFGQQGLFGLQVEERYGGLALRNRDVARVLEQAAGIDLALGTFLLVALFPGIRPLSAFGNDALRRELLPDLAAGRALAGYAQTEPGAGTHFPGMAACAVTDGDGWSVSGDKIWIGNATWARVLTVMAHEVDGAGRRRGLTALAVPTDLPGVALGREFLSLGMRGMVQSEVSFRGVRVGRHALVGEAQHGLEVGVDSMSFTRFAIAATCVGAMKRCIQLALRFAGRRSIATGALVEHPVILAYLGEAVAQTRAAEALVREVARLLDEGEGAPAELFAVCKATASEFLWQTVDRALQILGGRGYDESNGIAQMLRDARVGRIFEGTTEALLAFAGAWALNPRSELDAYLREELGATATADRLAEAIGALRARADAAKLSRAWQCALGGQAASWSVTAALLARDAARAGDVSAARAAEWARRCFEGVCAEAGAGGVAEAVRLDPPDVAKLAEEYAGAIGDVEQQLPGERRELDPLLRRDADA